MSAPVAIAADAAVVVVDVQNDYCDPDGVQGRVGRQVRDIDGTVDRTAALLARARAAGVPVIFVTTVSGPETDTPQWVSRYSPERPQCCRKGSWGAELYRLRPEPGDEIVEKSRHSAFTNTPLHELLQRLERGTLLFCGVATDICVESSLRAAICLDYAVGLIADCCGSYSEEAHGRGVASARALRALVVESDAIAW